MDFPCRPCSPFCFGQSGYDDDNDVDWKALLTKIMIIKMIREAFFYQEDNFSTMLRKMN